MYLFSYIVFFTLFAWLVVTVPSRKLVAVVVAGALIVSLTYPPKAEAQGGVIGAITSILNLIKGFIQTALTAVNNVRNAVRNLQQTVTFPLQLINQARSQITEMVNQYRALMRNILNIDLRSALLPDSRALESAIRNHNINDFDNLTSQFNKTFGTVPLVTDARPGDRAMSDMDDALTLDALKTLKASDQATDLELQAAESIENTASGAAPGSAPFISAAATASSIRSQALTQKMLAAELRQAAVHLAHRNVIRKTGATNSADVRGLLINLLNGRN